MAEESAAKRLKTTAPLIGTHNGHFHADEALAVYMLRLLPTYSASSIVRTRDPEILATCHTVVDVGGEYLPDNYRFDHHQRTFDTTFPSRGTKLSSAGLVYMHFGRAIISQRLGLPESHGDVDILYEKLYDDFIEAIDANDNGIAVYDPKEVQGIRKRFKDHGVTLASLVSDLNRPFIDPLTDKDHNKIEDAPDSQVAEDSRFVEASTLMGTSFLRKLYSAYNSWLPARSIVAKAYADRLLVDSSGSMIVLPRAGIPWKEHLYAVEGPGLLSAEQKILFVLYPESEAEDSKWRVQAVSISADSFESRMPLREEWRGLRDDELSGKAGVGGCIFVHASGFIGGNKTKEGALEMAKRTLVI